MLNKKIALSAMSILASLALLGGATFAFFSDAGTSSENIFSSGTLDMELTDSDEGPTDDVSGTWGLASAPGDPFSGDLMIKNTGSVDADHIELMFTNLVTEASSGPGTVPTVPMDRVIEVTVLAWDSNGDGVTDTNLLPGVVDTNFNGIIDLDDLENQDVDGPVDFDGVSFDGTQSADHTLHMEGELDSVLAVDQHQGDSVNMTLDVTMNQDASQ